MQGSPLAGLSIGGELAVSQLDGNTFSSQDDKNNNGLAYTGNIKFSREKLDLWGVKPHLIELSGSLRHRDKQFQEIARSSEIEFQRERLECSNQSGNGRDDPRNKRALKSDCAADVYRGLW